MDLASLVRGLLTQFSFEPDILRKENLNSARRAVVGGMGGSHLPAGMLTVALPGFPLLIHHDYGLPKIENPAEALYVAVSYSGNTEETLDFAKAAAASGLPLAAVSSGGALEEFAETHALPFVKVPSGFQPRMTVGYIASALLALLGKEKERIALAAAASATDTAAVEKDGKELAAFIADGIAAVYSSADNAGFAYYLKALLNENAKIAAFINQFPELNHNEMLGLLGSDRLPEFRIILLDDAADHPRVAARMDTYAAIAGERGARIRRYALAADPYERIARFSLAANWAAVETARLRGADPLDIALIEEFKKRIAP